MNIMKVTCGTCAGTGKHYNWKAVYMDDLSTTVKQEEIVCKACNGKGYTEYATFTLEEAKAILNHCGLSTES